MKRSECTVESLKALGYIAKVNFRNVWHFWSDDKECNEKQAKELFDAVIDVIHGHGGEFEIRRNYANYTVNVFLDNARHEYRGTEITYYLSRPMTEAEASCLQLEIERINRASGIGSRK